jgi:hypothetical protein
MTQLQCMIAETAIRAADHGKVECDLTGTHLPSASPTACKACSCGPAAVCTQRQQPSGPGAYARLAREKVLWGRPGSYHTRADSGPLVSATGRAQAAVQQQTEMLLGTHSWRAMQ